MKKTAKVVEPPKPINICLVIDGVRQEETSHDYVEVLDRLVLDHYLWEQTKQRRLPETMLPHVWLEIRENGVVIDKVGY